MRRTRCRPYTTIFSTMTVDGRIADETGFSRLSCEEDFRLLHEARAQNDAIMVGSRTVLSDDPRLNVRLTRGRDPLRIVVDSRLIVPLNAKIFRGRGKSILVTTEDHEPDVIAQYERAGIGVIQVGHGRVDLSEALNVLANKYGVRRLLVEGGGGLNYALLSGCLVDEIRVTVAPFVFGNGVSLFRGEKSLWGEVSLVFLESEVLCGGWVHLRYRVYCNGFYDSN